VLVDELRLPARASELARARACLRDAAARFGLEEEERGMFVLAANEAVTNAIRHGAPDADGTILLRIESEGERLTVAVTDYGVFRSRLERGPWADGGRGFPLMHALGDVTLGRGAGTTTVRVAARRPALR
jgi:anti-sigma regulatory factor (Ser/Thr protein kinase)